MILKKGLDFFSSMIPCPIHNRNMKWRTLKEVKKTALLAMLRTMLVFRPKSRLTVAEILETVWMRKWSLPVLEKV